MRILNSWVGHPKLCIIDNSTDFNGKMNRVVNTICRMLGVPRPAAIERKFLVKEVGELPLECSTSKTETTFLIRARQEEGYIFVRKREAAGNTMSVQIYFQFNFLIFKKNRYTYSAKQIFSDNSSAIIERQLSASEYGTLLSQSSNPNREVVFKKVKCFVWNNHYFELNYFIHPQPGLVILKTDAETADQQIPLPPFVEVVEEVTDNLDFSTFTLAGPTSKELELMWKEKVGHESKKIKKKQREFVIDKSVFEVVDRNKKD